MQNFDAQGAPGRGFARSLPTLHGEGFMLLVPALSRVTPLLRRPVPNHRPAPTTVVGAGLPANTVAAATVNGGWKLASRTGPFAGEPAPTTPVPNHRPVSTTVVGAGLPANTVAAATVNGGWKLASRAGLFAGKPAPTTACAQPPTCAHHRGRSGFTREYGGGGNGERRVEIDQQDRPFRG
ncbi:hypothetical protein J3A98_003266 [Pseudomonas sp. BP6]|nr:hypothetical protein [Pseudomonas sp. BP6]MBP2288457.1 hypothetical protein [Pseudomonas sp. BP7]